MGKVLIVAGPTGSGKSSYALKLAQARRGVILNGDSLQVYQGLEILTAQPSAEDLELIPHFLYGFLPPSETSSVTRWLSQVTPLIEECHKNNTLPIIVGGTGFYLRALLDGLSPIPSIDPEVRASLKAPQEELYFDLQKIDPVLARRIAPHDQQRVKRALEVFYGTGTPLSVWQKRPPASVPYVFEKILLMPPKEELIQNHKNRLEEMFQRGVIKEVKAFLAASPSPTACQAIGVREIKAFLEGLLSLEETKTLILTRTHQYAKRQRTWFRHQYKAD